VKIGKNDISISETDVGKKFDPKNEVENGLKKC